MATVPYPLDDVPIWNSAQLGPDWMPGRFECDKIPLARNVKVNKPGKKSKGTLSDQGYELAKFGGKLHQWTRQQHVDFQRLLPKWNPRREGATKNPFELKCAQTIEAGITAVTITSISCGPWDSKGKRVIEFEFQEWAAAPKDVKKGTGKVLDATQAARPGSALVGELTQTTRAPGQPDPLKPTSSTAKDPSSIEELMKAFQ
jgi:hypothetical protein